MVIDTSVIVAALRSRHGASNALLRLVATGAIRPLVTTTLFLEYEDALKRPEHRLSTGLSLVEIDAFLAALASAAEPVEVHFRWRPHLRDPADEFVLEAAINGGAEVLVTHNRRDFESATARFGLAIRAPREVLQDLAP